MPCYSVAKLGNFTTDKNMDLSQISDPKLRASIEKIVSSLNDPPTDPEWQNYEVLNAALEQGRKDLANYLLDANCTVNRYHATSVNTPLHRAVKLGDAFLVKKLLEKGAAVTAINADFNSPLHLAFELERYELVDLLLSNIQETLCYDDLANKHGLTHLHIACARGNAQVVHDFEYTGSDIKFKVSDNSPIYPNYTCLRFVCESKSLATIKVVVKATDPLGSCANDTADQYVAQKGQRGFVRLAIKTNHEGFSFGEDRKTRLNDFQQACFHGRVDSVKGHLKNGKNVNSAMSLEAEACPLFTPLHFALEADENRQQVVELLLANGADVTLRNGFGMTPLHSALYNDQFREGKGSYDKIPKKDDTLGVIYAAVKDKEANPMDCFGLTYFHAAVAMNDLEMVRKFIERGEGVYQPILPNCRNFAKYTPLHFAVKYGQEDMAKLLIDQGADVNANENEMQFDTPVQTAIEYGQCKMVEFLLANGANADIKTYKKNETLLHLLVERFGDYDEEKDGLLRLLEILVKHGLDVDSKDHKLNTALHKSCSKFVDKRDVVYQLLNWGTDVNLKNCRGETSLKLASLSENQLKPIDYLKLYHHVQKVKDLGLKVEAINEQFCKMVMEKRVEWAKNENWAIIEKICNDEVLACKHQERLAEIERLKKNLLDEKVSLHDYLKMDVKQASAYVENEKVKKVMDSKEYENYGYTVSAMYHKTLQYLAAQNIKPHENVNRVPVNSAVIENVIVRRVNHAQSSSSNKTSKQQVPENISLHDAVKLGNVQLIKELLVKGSSLDAVDSNENSALHLAFILKQEEIVEFFLDYLKDSPTCSNLKNNHGLTYLHIAASRGNIAVVEKLLETRVDVTETVNRASPMNPNYTALQFACDCKAPDTIKVLLDAMNLFDTSNDGTSNDPIAKFASILCQKLNMSQIDSQLSPFHQACSTGTSDEVLEFLEAGQDVNVPARQEIKFTPLYTALHYAVESQCDRQEKVELLLKHGADVGLRNGLGMTSLHLAFYSTAAKNKIAEFFDESDEDETVKILYEATRNKEENLMDAFGLTYFHVAVAMNDLLLVKRILFQGEDVNRAVQPNPRGFSKCTPLHFAAEFGHEEMAKLLVARGANVNANEDDSRFDSPLQVAIVHGRYSVMDVLLKHGANANVVRADGANTIHLITERFRDIRKSDDSEEKLELASFVKEFVKRGVDVDANDANGFTALYSACLMMCGCYNLIDNLILAGANVNWKNDKGETAFDAASWSKVQGNYDDFLKLYNHAQRLKDLGLPVDPSGEKFCETVMKRKEFWKKKDDWSFFQKMYSAAALAKRKRERQEEIKRLKEDMLTESVSLYDYLRMDVKEAADYVENERIQWIIQDDEPRELYEIYGYLVPVVYRKSLEWIGNEESK